MKRFFVVMMIFAIAFTGIQNVGADEPIPCLKKGNNYYQTTLREYTFGNTGQNWEMTSWNKAATTTPPTSLCGTWDDTTNNFDFPGKGTYQFNRDMDGPYILGFYWKLIPETVNYTLKVTNVGNGKTLPASGSYPYAQGTPVTITATPDPNSTFGGWSGVTCTGGNTANQCNFTMNSDVNVTATFNAKPFLTWYKDSDGDGYASNDAAKSSQTSPGAGYYQSGDPHLKTLSGDCNDDVASIGPGFCNVVGTWNLDGTFPEGILTGKKADGNGNGATFKADKTFEEKATRSDGVIYTASGTWKFDQAAKQLTIEYVQACFSPGGCYPRSGQTTVINNVADNATQIDGYITGNASYHMTYTK